MLTYLQWKLGLEGTALGQFYVVSKAKALRNRTINTTIKQLSKCSMECSFCIWLARNNKEWFSKEIDLALKTPEDPLAHQNPLQPPPKQILLKLIHLSQSAL